MTTVCCRPSAFFTGLHLGIADMASATLAGWLAGWRAGWLDGWMHEWLDVGNGGMTWCMDGWGSCPLIQTDIDDRQI